MKKIVTVLFVIAGFSASAQEAFKGKGDTKFQVGANFQNGGTGIIAGADFGIGENMSLGFTGAYLLGASEILGEKPEFKDRFDVRGRFNANLGSVLNIDEKLDVYPGLDIGVKNFGGHLGARYFFTEGFGLYTEFAVPFAKYNSNTEGFNRLNNQFNVSFGMSFNI
jgi:hypothetical protein